MLVFSVNFGLKLPGVHFFSHCLVPYKVEGSEDERDWLARRNKDGKNSDSRDFGIRTRTAKDPLESFPEPDSIVESLVF